MRDFAKRYLEVLEGPLKGINLTRILNEEDFYIKQIFDSVHPLEISPIFKDAIESCSVVIDVGFGGGFPMVPLASLIENKKFIGIESKNKKAEAVKVICTELEIENVAPIHGRIEEFLIDEEAVIIFKAVGKIKDCFDLLNFEKKSKVFFYKGPGLYDQEDLKNLGEGIRKIEELSFKLPDDSQRILMGYEFSPVPRGTRNRKNKDNTSKNTKKNLVRISTLKSKLFPHK
jgi:16S rRNA (guanine527-N7)-methyltransferase